MIYTIENEALKVQIADKGAELMSIQTKDGNEYLWQGDAKYWSDRAINLFPYIARLTEGKYILDEKTYEMTIHGFANYSIFKVSKQEADSIVFELTDSEETLKMYPYAFSFRIIYSLCKNMLQVKFEVDNKSENIMYFGVGGHPGFLVPMEDGLNFEDFYLEFDKPENPVRVGFTETCFLNGEDKEYALSEGGKILMNHNLFDEDAIVLRDMAKCVTLKSDKSDRYVKVEYPEMDFLGIWHMPHTDAPYVCIEPWSSLPSRQDVIEDLAEKEDLISLEAGKTYENTWTIEIG